MSQILKRPLLLFALALIAGIVTASLSNSFLLSVSGLLLLGVCLHTVYGRIRTGFFIFIGMLLFYSLGAFEFLYLDRLSTGRFEDYGGKTVTVKGFVASEPDVKEARVTYIIDVAGIRSNGDFKESKGKILLTTILNEKSSLMDYGRELEFTGQLNLPRGVRNPGGFDYRRYLSQKGVSAMLFAANGSIKLKEGVRHSFLIESGRFLRMKIVNVIEKSLPRQQAGLLNGILIGYREGLTEEVKNAFSDAGLTHIMAVSGANVAFLVAPLAFLFKKLKLGRRISGAMIIGFLIVFVYITGFEPSVLRAVVMGVIMLLGGILMRETDIFTTISFAAVLLLIFSPYMLFNIGFQLSFAATISLVLLHRRIRGLLDFKFLPGAVADVLAATLAAQLGVLPVTLFYFNKLSVIALLSNLLVVPLMEVITVLGMLMAVLGQISLAVSQLIGYVNNLLLSFVLVVTKISAGLPFATIRLVTPSILLVAVYYAALWFFMIFKPGRKIRFKTKYAMAAGSLAVVAAVAVSLVPGSLEVVFLDVGEGDSAFIRTYSGKTVLLDGGGSPNPQMESTVGETVVIPFLLDYGVSRLDMVIASHGHTDHIQGLLPVLEQFKVKNLIIPGVNDEKEFGRLLRAAGERGVNIGRCTNGDAIRLDKKTVFQVFNPSPGNNTTATALNNTSLVLKLQYGTTEVLFTGDAEKEVEASLLSRNIPLESDILKVGHHGSDTSTSPEFLASVHPKAAVISVGKNNFGHPSPPVVQRLEDMGLTVFRTDEAGAVVMKSNGRSIKISRTVPETD